MDDAIVIGKGMVGNATMHALGITKFYSRSECNVSYEEISNYKYIFICLPTPTHNGKQDIDPIRVVIHDIVDKNRDNIIIIRSTVLPGVCRKLKHETGASIVHAPEFLTESTWKEDCEWPDLTVLGGDDQEKLDKVVGIFKSRFKGTEFIVTDTVTSETIKYAINCLYAVKVIYGNQIYDFCKDHTANYETVKKAMYLRKWIGKNHLDIFHNGGRGAGGKCLEKDLDAFATFGHLPLIEYANKLNKGLLALHPKNET